MEVRQAEPFGIILTLSVARQTWLIQMAHGQHAIFPPDRDHSAIMPIKPPPATDEGYASRGRT
jgi:hypothetical protein